MTFTFVFTALSLLTAKSQSSAPAKLELPKTAKTDYNYFVRTSYYSFTNWLKVGEIPNIYFYEFHMGKEIDSKNKVGVKLARVKLFQPLGIQSWDLDPNSKSEWFAGRIEEYGVGAFYQRTLWKGLYASAEVMPFLKVFLDNEDEKIENGFRLYTSLHLGYHIPLFKNRMFVEPQIHSQFWPINSKGPTGFKEQVGKHDNYFLFEPNIYIGLKFN
ncbi:MAG: hypothetical protein JJ975_00705 [Bacteroidia bacterium]|nr:hypothetical protein [Bacteroidia bacterium]